MDCALMHLLKLKTTDRGCPDCRALGKARSNRKTYSPTVNWLWKVAWWR
jgi:hypothetical protein